MHYSKIAMNLLLAGSGLTLSFSALAELRPLKPEDVVDLSGTVSMSHKQYWQGGSRHHQTIIVPYITHGPGPYAADLLIVDENTGPQLDCPPHMMPPLGSGLPNSGYWGTLTCDKVPIWQFLGETVRIDGRKILDKAPKGVSPIFTIDMLKKTESEIGRSFAPGDVVLYWSRYVDNYDLPGEAGRRLHIEPLEGKAPAFPTPNWEAQDYLGSKGVLAVALDSPSIGSFGEPDYVMRGPASINQTPRGLETHLALFKYGGIDVEGLQNFDKVPNGSLFINLAVNHVGSPTAETRAVAIVTKDLVSVLLPAVKAHNVVDLSVPLQMDNPISWPGVGIGNYAFPYYTVDNVVSFTGPIAPYWVNTHLQDSRTGTHITPPAAYSPPPGFDISKYDAKTSAWRKEYEEKFGPVVPSEMTSEKVPPHYLMGPARVIDVRNLVGSTRSSEWPKSPAITVDLIQSHEQVHGPIRAGEIVIFASGHTANHFRPLERGRIDEVIKGPLDGKQEGWPAATPETIRYLASKGVKHVATDSPSIGSVVQKDATMTYWAGSSAGMIFTEYLLGATRLPAKGAFYVFLNPRIENNHGGSGRSIAILPHSTQ